MNESDRIEIEELKAKIESLRERVAEMESLSTASGGGWDVSGEIRRPAILNCNPSYPIKPFTMLKNPAYGYDNYRMYVPDGCVLYGGVAVPVQGKDGEGWLDLGSGAEGNTYYGHVIPDANGNPDHVEVNTSSTASGALASFKIAYVGTSDGGDVQLANGIVSLGGGGGGGSGVSDYFFKITRVVFNSGTNGAIEFYGRTFTYSNGSLTSVSNESLTYSISTVPHSGV